MPLLPWLPFIHSARYQRKPQTAYVRKLKKPLPQIHSTSPPKKQICASTNYISSISLFSFEIFLIKVKRRCCYFWAGLMARHVLLQQRKETNGNYHYEPHIWFVCGELLLVKQMRFLFLFFKFLNYLQKLMVWWMMDYSVQAVNWYNFWFSSLLLSIKSTSSLFIKLSGFWLKIQ